MRVKLSLLSFPFHRKPVLGLFILALLSTGSLGWTTVSTTRTSTTTLSRLSPNYQRWPNVWQRSSTAKDSAPDVPSNVEGEDQEKKETNDNNNDNNDEEYDFDDNDDDELGEAMTVVKREPRLLNPILDHIQPSKTVEVFSKVKDMRAEGINVTGGLCVGEPDFGPPQEVIDAAVKALQTGDTRYTGVTGTAKLRYAIFQDLAARKDIVYDYASEIVVANGAKQAVYQGILAMAGVGDAVLIPAPYWPSYPEMVQLAGAVPVLVETSAETGFLMTPEQLRFALEYNPDAKLLILCNPSNPTGGVYSREKLQALCEVLQDFPDVYVLADEIYDQLVYGSEDDAKQGLTAADLCPSVAAMPNMWKRTLTVNGFSKAYAMTGFRLGYIAAPQAIAKAVTTLQSQFTSCASSIAQAAGLAALTKVHETWVPDKVKELKEKRDLCLQRLSELPHVHVRVPPQGAFYVLPDVSEYCEGKDDVQFCKDLLEEQKLALVPGTSFAAQGTVRISYATTVEELNEAMDKLKAFLENKQEGGDA